MNSESPPPPLPFPSSSLSNQNTNVHTRINSALSASPLHAHSRRQNEQAKTDNQHEQVFLLKQPRRTLALFASSLATSCLTVILSLRRMRLGHMLILIPTVVLVIFALMPQHDTAAINQDAASTSLLNMLNKTRLHIRFFIWWLVLGAIHTHTYTHTHIYIYIYALSCHSGHAPP